MDFASDNRAAASAPVSAALAALTGTAPSYGADDLTRSVERRLCDLFEREIRVFFVSTGTAANVLSLESLMKPGGVVVCHADAHILADEGGAVEALAGARLHGVPGEAGKLTVDTVARAIGRYLPAAVHHGRPVAVSLTQATEYGTVYRPDEIAGIADIARRHGMGVHMDGARFSNALVSLDVTPAEMTWKAGVDVLSLGATKNGCWCAESVVLFDPARAEDFAYAHKRSAQLISKSRFVAAQFAAWLEGGHWLENARHANAMARRLADGIVASGRGRLFVAPEANEVFAILDGSDVERLEASGAAFYPWTASGDAPADGRLIRLVTSFATDPAEVDRFVGHLAG
jgi:threonine aldolase